MTYAQDQDMYDIFGEENINLWADPNNTGDSGQISARKAWALDMGDSEFNGRLAEGPYDIPIPQSSSVYPSIVVYICACIAGVHLYDTRRVADSTRDEQVAQQRIKYQEMIRNIMKGILKLVYPDGTVLAKNCENTPKTYVET